MLRGVFGTRCNSLELLVMLCKIRNMKKARVFTGQYPNSFLFFNHLTLAGELGFEPRFSESESDALL
jgi:hypothetical protein